LTNKAWVGPNGETVAVPKDEGQGLMISAFQSHEFGFGMAVDNEQLKEVNRYCLTQPYRLWAHHATTGSAPSLMCPLSF